MSSTCLRLSCRTHGGSSTAARLCPVYSCSTSDAQWALLEPLVPPPGNTGGKGGRVDVAVLLNQVGNRTASMRTLDSC